jgi:hypothetical protein
VKEIREGGRGSWMSSTSVEVGEGKKGRKEVRTVLDILWTRCIDDLWSWMFEHAN